MCGCQSVFFGDGDGTPDMRARWLDNIIPNLELLVPVTVFVLLAHYLPTPNFNSPIGASFHHQTYNNQPQPHSDPFEVRMSARTLW